MYEYRSIDFMTVDSAYGMVDLTELIKRATHAKYVLSTIDLASAYRQVPMSSECKLLTSCRPRLVLFNGMLCLSLKKTVLKHSKL